MAQPKLAQYFAAILTTSAACSVQAATLQYDPAESSNYAIADITLSLTAFGGTNDVVHDSALLTDGDLSTGHNFGRFLDPGLLDVSVDLNSPSTTDLFRLTRFSVIFAIDGVPLDAGSPQLLFTDASGTPQTLSTTTTSLPNARIEVEAAIDPSGFLLDPGTSLTLENIDLPFTEPEALIREVIVEGSSEPIPEPSSLALLTLSGLLVTRRRRCFMR